MYDAGRRLAELARDVWRDRTLAERLDTAADALFARFQETFWCEWRGGQVYALPWDVSLRDG